MMAAEIFSNFLEAITRYVLEAKGTTVEANPGSLWDKTRWRNGVLASISEAAVSSEFVKSLEEVNQLVIPPFTANVILPTALSRLSGQPDGS
jgi:hypothetical protein